MSKRRNERSVWFIRRKQLMAHDRDICRWYKGCRQCTTGWFEFGVDFFFNFGSYAHEFFDLDPYRDTISMARLVSSLDAARLNGQNAVLDWVDRYFPEMLTDADMSGRFRFAEAVIAPG